VHALGEEVASIRPRITSPGGRIAHSLIREHLADDYQLTIHPVALGEGSS
jgi:dihydrofolate reductase